MHSVHWMHLILRVQICYIYLCVYPCIRTAYHFPRQSKICLSRGARDVATKFRNLRIFHFAQKLEGQKYLEYRHQPRGRGEYRDRGPRSGGRDKLIEPIGGKRVEKTARCRWLDHDLLVWNFGTFFEEFTVEITDGLFPSAHNCSVS